jgi:hypothetical protein
MVLIVARFEKAHSRRELVQGLAMLAAAARLQPAQEDINLKLQTSTMSAFRRRFATLHRLHRKMFGFTVVSRQRRRSKIVRLGNTKTLVSFNHGALGTVDHFAIDTPFWPGIDTSYLTQRGATPLQGNFAGLHVKDPDGVNVQISAQA